MKQKGQVKEAQQANHTHQPPQAQTVEYGGVRL